MGSFFPDDKSLRNSVSALLRPQKKAKEAEEYKHLAGKNGTVKDIKIAMGRCLRNEFLPAMKSPVVI